MTQDEVRALMIEQDEATHRQSRHGHDAVLADVEAYRREHGRLPSRRSGTADEQGNLRRRFDRLVANSSALAEPLQRRLEALQKHEAEGALPASQDTPRTKRWLRDKSNALEQNAQEEFRM